MEKLFYETRPYLFTLIACIALKAHSTHPMATLFSAMILLVCSAMIFYWRHDQRKRATVRYYPRAK